MTKYLPWFLFLTGIQSYASTANFESHNERDFVAFNCKSTQADVENGFKETALIELRKKPNNLTNTLRANISFNLIIRPQDEQAAVYVNGGVFAVLKKDHQNHQDNTYSSYRSHYDQFKNTHYQSIYRVGRIRLDSTLHQITARLTVSQRTISNQNGKPHYSNYLTRAYQCVSE